MYDLSIFSSEGRAVLSQTVINNSYIDLKLASGLYMVVIETEDKRITKKIIVE